MRFLLPFIICVFGASCTGQVQSELTNVQADTTAKDLQIAETEIQSPEYDSIIQQTFFPVKTTDTIPYRIRRNEAELLRANLYQAHVRGTIDIDSVGRAFEAFLLNAIIPHWYGTPWDFEGHTDTPNDGEVACGYLVSTTLRHMNVQINRYHLAQQAAYNGAKSLAIDMDRIHTYHDLNALDTAIDDGLYMVGLSFHVGYLYKTGRSLFFVHSNYMNEMCVMIEDAYASDALNASDVYVLVRIGNADLMTAWLEKKTVTVYRD